MALQVPRNPLRQAGDAVSHAFELSRQAQQHEMLVMGYGGSRRVAMHRPSATTPTESRQWKSKPTKLARRPKNASSATPNPFDAHELVAPTRRVATCKRHPRARRDPVAGRRESGPHRPDTPSGTDVVCTHASGTVLLHRLRPARPSIKIHAGNSRSPVQLNIFRQGHNLSGFLDTETLTRKHA